MGIPLEFIKEATDIIAVGADYLPYLVAGGQFAVKTAGEETVKAFGKKIAEDIWGKLKKTPQKDKMEEAARNEDGEALKLAIAEALAGDQTVRHELRAIVYNHNEVIQNNNIDMMNRIITGDHASFTFIIQSSQSEPAAPPPPQITSVPTKLPPYYVHPYGGTNFTGRAAELEMLDAWAAGEGKPVMAWIAIGGMGKSALTWHWTHLHEADYEGVLWWSFYDAPFASFLTAALRYFGAGQIDPNEQRGRQGVLTLASLLAERRFLLVLDGFEREMNAYRGLNAAYQGDDPTDDHPAWGDERLHCIDALAEDLLRAVGTDTDLKSRVLLTSRLFPNALADRFGTMLDGVQREDLRQLSPEDAVELFHSLGITGTRADIQRTCEPLGYHPFSLRLLAGYLGRKEQRNPRDISAAPNYPIGAEDVVAKRTHMLQVAYDDMAEERQQFLGKMAAFRSPVDYETVTILVEDAKQTQIDDMLGDLQTRGLIFRDEAARYDLHPIIRRYAYEKLLNKKQTHESLRDHFATLPTPSRREITSVDDLMPVIELYHHTVSMGEYDGAFDLFANRFGSPLFFQLGAYQTVSDLLRLLFPDGEEALPRLGSEADQSWTLNALAGSYSLAGKPRRAIPLVDRVNDIYKRLGETGYLAIGLGNLADDQMKVGRLREAAANLNRRIELSQEIEDQASEAIGHKDLGRVLAYAGRYEEAAQELAASVEMLDAQYKSGVQTNSSMLARAYRAEMHLFGGEPEAALETMREAETWRARVARDQYPFPRDEVRNKWLLGASQRELGHLSAADSILHEALDKDRRINMVDHEADIMLEIAHLRRDQGERGKAQEMAEDALLIAERAGYVLQQADLHYLLALLAQDAGEIEAAREHAGEAFTFAECDGPPDWTYKRTYDASRELLAELAV